MLASFVKLQKFDLFILYFVFLVLMFISQSFHLYIYRKVRNLNSIKLIFGFHFGQCMTMNN